MHLLFERKYIEDAIELLNKIEPTDVAYDTIKKVVNDLHFALSIVNDKIETRVL